jgi:phosphatidylethanolamine-binding protein (PEBP) family uncharacterized protein
VAQRTGSDGLISRPPSKVASAGVIPALAIALALAVSSCGGDSDQTETASTPRSPSSPSSVAKPTRGDEKAGPSPSSKAPPSTSPEAVPAGPGPQDAKKQGTPIKAPVGPREPEPTPAQLTRATVANISLESPAIRPVPGSVGALPAAYTCDGKDNWPALRWAGVPAGTAELVLFAMNVQPVGGKLFFDWALAGLDPALEGIEADRLPKGAVLGRNSFGKTGYSICPPGAGETHMFALYALPEALSVQKGFDPRTLRKEALRISGNVGLLAAVYVR